jgi:hypothetical protein
MGLMGPMRLMRLISLIGPIREATPDKPGRARLCLPSAPLRFCLHRELRLSLLTDFFKEKAR